ncbi:DUF1120 domain-containing protein [Vibrio sp. NH-UV-68]|uniref:DUF1120 domain-containing protein n=1 Tax=unclassified Vibrio TaxID=2614977 RepID=UPI0036F25F3E
MKMLFFPSLLIIAGSAMAAPAPNSELTVSGTVRAPSCTVTASEAGVYNFGEISSSQVGREDKKLGTVKQTYTINCDATTYLTFKTVDNRSDSVTSSSTTRFGLGKNGDQGNIGYYTGRVINASVDGELSKLMQSETSSFNAVESVVLTNSSTYVTGWAEGSSKLKSGRNFQADVEITPYLSRSSDFGPIVSNVELDGSATMNFAFSI